jgi:HEAT repeat protein
VEPAALPAVLERLVDPAELPGTQVALATVLAQNHAAGWTDALLELVGNHPVPEVRAALLGACKGADAGVARQGLLTGLADPSSIVRAEAARLVGWRKDGATFGPHLKAAFADADPGVRAAAARSAGWLRLDVRGELRSLAADPAAQVRYEALNALLRIAPADARALPNLEALRRDADPRVARVAARAATNP